MVNSNPIQGRTMFIIPYTILFLLSFFTFTCIYYLGLPLLVVAQLTLYSTKRNRASGLSCTVYLEAIQATNSIQSPRKFDNRTSILSQALQNVSGHASGLIQAQSSTIINISRFLKFMLKLLQLLQSILWAVSAVQDKLSTVEHTLIIIKPMLSQC